MHSVLGAILSFAANNTTNGTSPPTSTPLGGGISILNSTIGSFLFPFLLVFAIVYGVLERSQTFGGKRDINSIIAFVIAIIFATTGYTLNLTLLILPIVGIIAVVIFMLLVLSSMIYGDVTTMPPYGKKLIGVIAFLISVFLVIWILVGANFALFGLSPASVEAVLANYAPYIVVFIVLALAAYWLFK